MLATNRLKKRAGHDAASLYDPATMERVPDARVDEEDGADDFPGTEFCDGEESVDDGIDIASLRRGGMSPFDRRVRRTFLCSAILCVVIIASIVIAVSFQRTDVSSSGGGGGSPPHAAKTLAAPPKDLSRKCSPVSVSRQIGWDDCKRLCKPAECCMFPVDHWFSCKVGNEQLCSAYEYACETLDHLEKLQEQEEAAKGDGGGGGSGGGTGASPPQPPVEKVVIPPAPSDIDSTCAATSLATVDGFEACLDVCNRASCCDGMSSDEPIECAPSNPNACKGYGACDILTATPASHPDAVSSIAKKKCNTQALTNKGGVSECAHFCVPASCCFSDQGRPGAEGPSCSDEGAKGWCEQYAPCQGLLHLDDQSSPLDEKTAKDAVQEACTAGFRECMNICEAAECCFLSGKNQCQSHGLGEIDCSHYQACQVLHVTSVETDFESGTMKVKVPIPPNDLDLLCLSPRKDDQGKCYRACKAAHCCDELLEICMVLDPEVCEAYDTGTCDSTWDILMDEVVVKTPPTDLGDTCGLDGDSEVCAVTCGEALCCLPSNDRCTVYNPEVCTEYEQYCQVIWDPPVLAQLKPPPSWLKEHCGSNADSTECRDGCRESLCCGNRELCVDMTVTSEVCAEYVSAGCIQAWEELSNGDDKMDEKIARVYIPKTPPSNLETVCGSTDPADDEKCVKLCRDASCCEQPNDFHCSPLNPAACDAYYGLCTDAWHWQSQEVTIPPLPDDIDTICRSGIGQTLSDAKKCQDICRASQCCQDDNSATDLSVCTFLTNPEMCGMYEDHCHDMWNGKEKKLIPPPPSNLPQVCSSLSMSTSKGISACRDACAVADCCADENKGCGDEYSNRDVCSEYSPCIALYSDEAIEENGVTIPDPPANLEQICSIEALATAGGHDHCAVTCDPSHCCNVPIEECRVNNVEVCEKYKPCTVLHTKDANKYSGFVEIPAAPAEIDKICSADELRTIQGFTHCEDVCDRARCCEETVDECNVKNPAVCDGYEACSFLYVNGGAFDEHDQATLMALTDQVTNTCNPANLWNHQNLTACQHVCNDRLCCFEKDAVSSCLSSEECFVFSACENLMSYGFTLGASDPKDSSVEATANSYVEKFCTSDSLSTVAGINACWERCSPYLCCFSYHEDENCYDEQQEVCDSYSACSSVVRPFEDDTEAEKAGEEITKEVVREACSATSLATKEGLSNCHRLCGPHMCCFVKLGQQSNCVDTLGHKCMVYGACSVLADYEDDVKTVQEVDGASVEIGEIDAVNGFCSPATFENDEESKLRCVDICSQRACCFTEGAGSCYETDTDWCNEFEACDIIHSYEPDGAGQHNPPSVEGDDRNKMDRIEEFKVLCNSEALRSDIGLKTCKGACEPYVCCWDKGNQCYDKDAKDCDIVVGCEELANFLVQQQENKPEKLCTKDAISTLDGAAACKSKCDERGCCWNNSPTGNCYTQYEKWCDEFDACKILGPQ